MTSLGSGELLLEHSGGVTRLTLHRLARRNALSIGLLNELNRCLDDLAVSEETRVVVLAAGGSVFCSGHDLAEMVGREQREYYELFTLCSQVMLKLRRLPQPVIARVQGPATAAGCQLVAACDLAVAVDSATFATPGVKIGLFCSTPMVPLVRTIAPRAAMEMLLTGKPISAARALEWNLVNRVVPADRLDSAVSEFVEPLLASSPLTLRLGKEAFYRQLSMGESGAYELAIEVMTRNACTSDAQEGMSAFLEKRPPQWRGE